MARSTQKVGVAHDTWASSANPSKERGGSAILRMQDTDAYAYLMFPKPFRQGMTIVSATLRVYTKGAWSGTTQLTAQRIADSWLPSRLNWNNRPGVTGATVSVSHTGANNTEYAFDVTSQLQTVANGAKWYGFRISTTASSNRDLRSKNDTHHEPTLEVTWSEAPQQPTDLSPSGGRAVSLNNPTVSARFLDRAGSTALQAVQVQVNSSNSFTSPSFDSGTVATTESELDLNTTAFAGVTAGNTVYWRIRFQDEAGLWSPWSDVESWNRDTKGSLTIDNPAASPNDYVDEWTPEINWTFTGETQESFRVWILDPDDPTNEFHDSETIKSTATEYTLPPRVLTDPSATYLLRLRVWDTKDRQATPGDPRFVEATRLFTYHPDPTTDPVTSISVSQLKPAPWVEVEFQRGTQPDRWLLVRDGENIREYDGDNPFVTGTTYRITDRNVSGRRSHTWEVHAIVNGKTSDDNPTASLAIEPEGIWLYADLGDDKIQVLIDTDDAGDSGSWSTLEQGATIQPLNAGRVVRVTGAIGGPTGTVSGVLKAIPELGTSYADQRNAWETIKRFPGRTVTLSMGMESFDAVVWNMTLGPVDESRRISTASFEFAYDDDLPFRVRY